MRWTLRELAIMCGCTSERIRQIEQGALHKISRIPRLRRSLDGHMDVRTPTRHL